MCLSLFEFEFMYWHFCCCVAVLIVTATADECVGERDRFEVDDVMDDGIRVFYI